ncbi:MAG: hypothetical protein ACI9V8_000169 [Urechidicola sp.]|jgi:hypothetical protein
MAVPFTGIVLNVVDISIDGTTLAANAFIEC